MINSDVIPDSVSIIQRGVILYQIAWKEVMNRIVLKVVKNNT